MLEKHNDQTQNIAICFWTCFFRDQESEPSPARRDLGYTFGCSVFLCSSGTVMSCFQIVISFVLGVREIPLRIANNGHEVVCMIDFPDKGCLHGALSWVDSEVGYVAPVEC